MIATFVLFSYQMNYELKHIHGIPYYLSGTTVHTFECVAGKPAANTVAIGTYDSAANSITYFPNWRDIIKSNLDVFRSSITIQERDKLRKSIIKPTKPRKATRTPRKSAIKTTNTPS